ncbi:MAG: M23 family metallopeptidase [Rhizobiaceae bacterium]
MSRWMLIAPMMITAWSASAFELGLPVQCAIGTECFVQQFADVQPGPDRQDPFCGKATYDGHDGTDIRVVSMKDIQRDVPVLAMADGTVLQTRDGVEDRLVKTKQEADAITRIGCGNAVFIAHEDDYQTRYCHMRKGSIAVRSGDKVKRGQQIGLIGASGLAQFPHVEVAVKKGRAMLDPVTGQNLEGGCLTDATKAAPLFSKQDAGLLGRGEVQMLGVGLAGDRVEYARLAEDGPPPAATTSSPLALGWVWVMNLRQGDQVQVRLTGPDGAVIAEQTTEPMDAPKATYSAFAGKRGAPVAGDYQVHTAVIRDGSTVIEKTERVAVQ